MLKGGLMLRVWKAPVTRPTKDVDLLGRTKNTVANLVSIVQQVCSEPVEPDGMQFDGSTAVGTPINEDAEYNGIRIKFTGLLGVARARSTRRQRPSLTSCWSFVPFSSPWWL